MSCRWVKQVEKLIKDFNDNYGEQLKTLTLTQFLEMIQKKDAIFNKLNVIKDKISESVEFDKKKIMRWKMSFFMTFPFVIGISGHLSSKWATKSKFCKWKGTTCFLTLLPVESLEPFPFSPPWLLRILPSSSCSNRYGCC